MKRVKWLLLFSLILNVIGLVFFVIGFSTHFWLESDKNYRTSSGFESVSTRVPVKLCHNVGPRCFVDKFRLRITAIPIKCSIGRLIVNQYCIKFKFSSQFGKFFYQNHWIEMMSNSFTWEQGVVIMLECIVVLSLYPEMQKHLIIKIGICFGNFNQLNQKTPTFMYCFFKLKWLFYVLSRISNLIISEHHRSMQFLQNYKCLFFLQFECISHLGYLIPNGLLIIISHLGD